MADRAPPAASLAIDGHDTGWPVHRAVTVAARVRGLLWGRHARSGAILALAPCGAVHTFGMQRPIDVVFTDLDGRVTRVCAPLHPCRLALAPGAGIRAAGVAWEAPAGLAALLGIRVGQRLEARDP